MKAIRFHGVGDVRCEDVPQPSPAPGEVLIRVAYAGICGSDLHIFRKGMFVRHVPETMGHEFVGHVVAYGVGVKGLTEGQTVIANPMVPCGACPSCAAGQYNTCDDLSFIGECRPGCFASYVALPAREVIPVPAGDLQHLALCEPLAVALNICERAKFSPGDRVAVLGAGPIGLLTIAAARALYGVSVIDAYDCAPERLRLAQKVGAAAVGAAPPDGAQYDFMIDAAGVSATLQTGLRCLRAGGTLLVVSIFENPVNDFDINAVVAHQLSLVGCNVYEKRHLFEAAEAIASGKIAVEPLISAVYPPESCGEAFARLTGADKTAAKVLFTFA